MNAWIEVLKSKNRANVINYYFLCTSLQWILCMVVRDICFIRQLQGKMLAVNKRIRLYLRFLFAFLPSYLLELHKINLDM